MSSNLFGPLIAALSSFAVWWLIPGSAIDRAWFSLSTLPLSATSALSGSDPGLAIGGSGTHEAPYQLKTYSQQKTEIADQTPTEILITDDPDQIFQSSPPSPIDFAVILKNLQRMDRQSIAIAMPLFWNDPDTIATVALERQLEAFPSIITSSPLSRSPKDSLIPPAFQRASIPLSAIRGNSSLLPAVNHIPVPDIILGRHKALAGFSILESEPLQEAPRLMARWGDRVVFSFQLLAALEHLKISPDELDIVLGESIKLGTRNHRIPIDEFGRLRLKHPLDQRFETTSLTAESLINAPDDALSGIHFNPIVIRDQQPTIDERSARFSNQLARHIAIIASPGGPSTTQVFTRLQKGVELLLLSALLFAITAMLEALSKNKSRLTLGALAAFILILHFSLISTTGTVLPTLPAITAILISLSLTFRKSFAAGT